MHVVFTSFRLANCGWVDPFVLLLVVLMVLVVPATLPHHRPTSINCFSFCLESVNSSLAYIASFLQITCLVDLQGLLKGRMKKSFCKTIGESCLHCDNSYIKGGSSLTLTYQAHTRPSLLHFPFFCLIFPLQLSYTVCVPPCFCVVSFPPLITVKITSFLGPAC